MTHLPFPSEPPSVELAADIPHLKGKNRRGKEYSFFLPMSGNINLDPTEQIRLFMGHNCHEFCAGWGVIVALQKHRSALLDVRVLFPGFSSLIIHSIVPKL